MEPSIYAPATTLLRALRQRQISSEELTRAYLARIAAVNPQLNAVVQVTGDTALTEARDADAALASGRTLGPLHGLPITIKDAFDTAGFVSTGGTLGRANNVPAQDATAVARLRSAGAVILGKTNVPELSLAFETDNLIYGRTNNPYDLARTPGGSSGGEAAIIAAGGSAMGIGTDAAGSIRWPSHCCGLAGLKPTHGRVPTSGAFPPTVGALGPLWSVGPIARSVDDLALMLPLLAGPDGFDPAVVPAPLGDLSAVDVRSLRVAFHADNTILTPTDEIMRTVKAAAKSVEDAGAQVEEALPTGVEQSFELTGKLFGADAGATVQQLLQMVGTQQPSPLLSGLGAVLQQFAQSTAEFEGLLIELDIFRATMLSFMQRYDAIVAPVNANVALPHGTTLDPDKLPGFSYTMAYNLTGWPAAVVRAGTSAEGLPIGVQVIAPPWREDVALALVKQIETALGGWQQPPI